MRSVRSELASVLTVLAVPAGILAVFPYGVLGFQAKPSSDPARRACRTAIVALPDEDERAAFQAARASWQRDEAGVRRLRANLLFADLPAAPHLSVLDVEERSRPPALPAVECRRVPFLPSAAAATPARIGLDGTAKGEPAFSRAELLKID